MLKVYFGLKVLGMAAFAITKTKWFKDLKEKVEEKTKIGR